jgi:hypothetical protein
MPELVGGDARLVFSWLHGNGCPRVWTPFLRATEKSGINSLGAGTRLAMRMLMLSGLAALLTIGVVPATGAHADSSDDRYLSALASQGITGDPGQLIADGRAACDNYGGPALVG